MRPTKVLLAWLPGLLLILPGCMRPRLMPVSHLANRNLGDGGVRLLYDTDNDGRGDYAEQRGPDGRVRILHFDSDRNGELDLEVALDKIADSDCRELLVIIDSVPYQVVRDLKEQGRFGHFSPPSRIIAPFPVMTDLSLAEFFSVSPCMAMESSYYDGQRLHRGYVNYFKEGNAPWMSRLDAYIWPMHHSQIYLHPEAGYLHELHHIEQVFFRTDQRCVSGYCVGGSALGSIHGRAGHESAVLEADRFCQSLMQRTMGRVRITLMSDHGHNLIESKYYPLKEELAALGYHSTNHLSRGLDVVIPRFGPVTCVGLYTRVPGRLAHDAVKLPAVELSFWKDGEIIVVESAEGKARVARSENGYRYEAESGDPLGLLPVAASLRQEGRLDGQGFASDSDWFEATRRHQYPDALQRLWRAFNGLVKYTPDVILSLKDGYVFSTRFFNAFVKMESAHGSLRDTSTFGFVMSTSGSLPADVRMGELASELEKLGLRSTMRLDRASEAVEPSKPEKKSMR